MKYITCLLVIMSMNSCSSNSGSGNPSREILNKLGVLEEFQKAVAEFSPEALEKNGFSGNKADLEAYRAKYFNPNIDSTVIKTFEQAYSAEEIDMIRPLNAEAIISHDPAKFKSFEDKIEKLYDAIYLDAQKLKSGIKETQSPNIAKPFAGFEVQKPNGIYVVTSYDSQMPQHSQINQEALISESDLRDAKFKEISHFSYGVSFQFNENNQQKIKDLIAKDQQTIIVLIVDHRMVSLRQVNLIQDGKDFDFFAPWDKEEVEGFAKSLSSQQ